MQGEAVEYCVVALGPTTLGSRARRTASPAFPAVSSTVASFVSSARFLANEPTEASHMAQVRAWPGLPDAAPRDEAPLISLDSFNSYAIESYPERLAEAGWYGPAGELVRATPASLTRTAIIQLFQRNKPAAELARALGTLQELGLVRAAAERAKGRRDAERWHALFPRTNSNSTNLTNEGGGA